MKKKGDASDLSNAKNNDLFTVVKGFPSIKTLQFECKGSSSATGLGGISKYLYKLKVNQLKASF